MLYNLQELWKIESHLIFDHREELLKFDTLTEDDIEKIWLDIGDIGLSKHMRHKYAEYDYDPAFFFSGIDPICKQWLTISLTTNMINITKIMNFFFWLKNTVQSSTFNDKEINTKWKNWKDECRKPGTQKTISFFFSFTQNQQEKLIENYKNYFK